MQRILIVEDNKTLAKLISKKVASELGFEVDVAYSMSEAKLFTIRYSYFLTLLDVNLPDAPNGEVIDYMLEKQNRVIVLSGNIDKTVRAALLQKNIIDYVNKDGVENILYIISTIKRLQNNQNHKILIVDDSSVARKHLQTLLENLFFKVIAVAHGEEALNLLETIHDVSLVLTDYHMPVMDGLELTKEIRKKYSKNSIGVITISGDEDEDTTAMFLKNGANDYIKKPFSKEEFSCRINNTIEALENIHLITNHANRDFLTGLYNRRYFYATLTADIQDETIGRYGSAVVMMDIDHFKKINDTHGHDAGDMVIIALADILRTSVDKSDIVARFGGEEFCLYLSNVSRDEALKIVERIRKSVQESVVSLGGTQSVGFTISAGVAMMGESGLDEVLGEADMMLYQAKNSGRNMVMMAE